MSPKSAQLVDGESLRISVRKHSFTITNSSSERWHAEIGLLLESCSWILRCRRERHDSKQNQKKRGLYQAQESQVLSRMCGEKLLLKVIIKYKLKAELALICSTHTHTHIYIYRCVEEHETKRHINHRLSSIPRDTCSLTCCYLEVKIAYGYYPMNLKLKNLKFLL